MRSLRPEYFFTSEVVHHTCGPTQTVAKCVSYRWSIQYFFVLRGANNIVCMFFKTILRDLFIIKNFILAIGPVVESFEILPIDGRSIKSYS